MGRFASAHVPQRASVKWNILALTMRIETEDLKPQLEKLIEDMIVFKDELTPLINKLERLYEKVKPLMEKAEDIKADATPIWTDDYNLCGDPECDGDCRVCQEGEYDGEEDYTEKYCRRGKR